MSPRSLGTARTSLAHTLAKRGLGTAFWLCLGGCWTLTGSTDDLVGGRNGSDPAVRDGGPGTRDGATPGDGATPPPPGEGGVVVPGEFCAGAGAHTYCEDFEDTAKALGAPWTVGSGGGGLIGSADAPVAGGRHALRMTLPQPCDNAFAQLFGTSNQQARTLRFAADVNVVSMPTTAAALLLFTFGWRTATVSYRLGVAYQDGRLAIHENDIGGTGFRVPATATTPFPRNKFARVEAAFVVAGGPPTVAVTVDGVANVSSTLTPVSPVDAVTDVEVGGYIFNGCDQVTELYMDNITYDFVGN